MSDFIAGILSVVGGFIAGFAFAFIYVLQVEKRSDEN